MSRTDLDPTTLAEGLRRMAGDGSMEWVSEPIQTSVLLDVADMLAENAKLRELVEDMLDCIDIQIAFERVPARWMQDEFTGRARELGIEVTA